MVGFIVNYVTMTNRSNFLYDIDHDNVDLFNILHIRKEIIILGSKTHLIQLIINQLYQDQVIMWKY